MSPPNVLVLGTGEYVTGMGPDAPVDSDKGAGVIALVLLDLARQGQLGEITLCGRDGARLPAIRQHLAEQITARYAGLDASSLRTLPADGARDEDMWRSAIAAMTPGDLVMVVTPDHLHAEMTLAAIEAGLHTLVVKPLVHRLDEHQAIIAAAARSGVLVMVEQHKRFDPIYSDARARMRTLGPLGFFSAYMSQPLKQLRTFQRWAGIQSDISYYLNAHHIDLLCWMMAGRGRPERVTASRAAGLGAQQLGRPIEDTITLLVDWTHCDIDAPATSVFTASWTAPEAEVHSQQRFFCLCHGGEVRVDQAHRGYELARTGIGLRSLNPLYMRYEPQDGEFVGQSGYGYRGIAVFVEAVAELRARTQTLASLNQRLPTACSTLQNTAILEAGRRSLDTDKPVVIRYNGDTVAPIGFLETK